MLQASRRSAPARPEPESKAPCFRAGKPIRVRRIASSRLSARPRASSFPVQQVAPARDHDRAAHDHRRVRQVAEHQVPQQHHPDDLLVEEGPQYRGGRVAVREREQVVAHATGDTDHHRYRPGQPALGGLPHRDRERRQRHHRHRACDELCRLGRIVGREVAGEEVEQGIEHGVREREQQRRMERVSAGTHDHQHADEAHEDRDPPRTIQALSQQRGGEDGDQDRNRELDRAGLCELQVLQRPEVQPGHHRQEAAARELQPGPPGAHQRQAVARRKQGGGEHKVHEEPQEHHFHHGQRAHQPLRASVQHREAEERDGDQADTEQAAPCVVRMHATISAHGSRRWSPPSCHAPRPGPA